MRIVGLTGSIGMGKTTSATMFAKRGVPVHGSDQSVHDLYSGKAVPLIEKAFPGSTVEGRVDRAVLAERVLGHDDALRELEQIIHPLVREEEHAFVEKQRNLNAQIVVLDIPLLLESEDTDRVDMVVVVTADPSVQEKRVLARPGMSEDRFRAILSNQMPDADKRKHAHFLIDTGYGLAAAERQVDAVLRAIAFTR